MSTRFKLLDEEFELGNIVGENVRDVRIATKGEVALPMLLYAAVEGESPMLNRLAEERPDQFCEVIWQLCRHQAAEKEITKKAFIGALLMTTAQDEAEKALAAGLPFFFRDETKRQLMNRLAEIAIAIVNARNSARAAAVVRIDEEKAKRRAAASTTTGTKNSSSPSPAESDSTPCGIALPKSGEPSADARNTTTSSSA